MIERANQNFVILFVNKSEDENLIFVVETEEDDRKEEEDEVDSRARYH
jgi:hypothetical protein